MTPEYVAYLESPQWKAKRLERLKIGKGRCAACGAKGTIQVHHLTYERIFKEEMADLLPLCILCHESAEKLVRDKFISRKGNVLFLATETVRLICSKPAPSQFVPKIKPAESVRVVWKVELKNDRLNGKTTNPVQVELLSQKWFSDLLALNHPAKQFKKLCRKMVRALYSKKQRNRFMVNAVFLHKTHASKNPMPAKDITESIKSFQPAKQNQPRDYEINPETNPF